MTQETFQTMQVLTDIKGLIERGQDDDRLWKGEMLDRFDLVNGTVKIHTTAIALLEQTVTRNGKDLEQVCEQVRTVELSQAKAAGIGAVVGAAVAAIPQLITLAKTLLVK